MKRLLVPAVVVACTVAVASAAGTARASTCQPYRATGSDSAASLGAPFVGTEDVTLGKTTYTGVPAVTTILAPLTPEGKSGVLTTTTSHAISLPSGTITTIDKVHLIPTQTPGVYKLVSHVVIVGGASGQLQVQGLVNLATLSAAGTIVGTVCGLG
jgi:hypothetical protein